MPTPLLVLVLALVLVVIGLVSVLGAVLAVLLARWDGATLPAALLRGGVCCGSTATVLTAVLALTVSVLT
ncbi:hypothetical protein AB0J38_41985 [Streptomyces sp. NPDC050095]|uniref:hypothetical protein n=1 Tax=unclassified Streptomyces TaxID=2593676 RepID=UPI0034462B1A